MGVLHSSRAQLAATDTKSTFTAMVHAKMPHPSEWTFLSQPLENPLTPLPPPRNRCGRVPQMAKPSANWRTKRVRCTCAKMPELGKCARLVAIFRWRMASHPSTPTPVPCGQTIPMSDAAKQPGKAAGQKMSVERSIKTSGTNPKPLGLHRNVGKMGKLQNGITNLEIPARNLWQRMS